MDIYNTYDGSLDEPIPVPYAVKLAASIVVVTTVGAIVLPVLVAVDAIATNLTTIKKR